MKRSTGFTALALVLPLAGVLPAAAQESEGPVRPHVAELVRAALNRPDDAAAWTGLADLLPELALTDEADVVTVFEASRLADSLASAPVPVPPAPQEEEAAQETDTATALPASPQVVTFKAAVTASVQELVTDLRSGALWNRVTSVRVSRGTLLATAPWALVGVLLLTGTVVRQRKARTRRPVLHTSRPAPRKEAKRSRNGKDERLWTVTTLAESGLPPAEIARRTGMAQDAVHVLLGLRDTPRAPASRRGFSVIPEFAPPAPAARPPSLGEQAAGISAARVALTRDSKRLKDGRLTYGPGRVA